MINALGSLLNFLVTGKRPPSDGGLQPDGSWKEFGTGEMGNQPPLDTFMKLSPLETFMQFYTEIPKTKPKKPTERGTPWAHDRKPNSEAPDDIYISEEDSDYAPAIKDVPQRDWFPDAGKYEDTTLRNEKLRGYRKSTNIEDRRPIAGAKGYVRPEKKPIRPTDKIRVGAGAGDKAKLR